MKTIANDNSGLQMSLPARAENVAVVRHALAGLAERIGMDEASQADLKTVVTEACMNVVVHAYPEGEDGLLEVEAPLPISTGSRSSSATTATGSAPARTSTGPVCESA